MLKAGFFQPERTSFLSLNQSILNLAKALLLYAVFFPSLHAAPDLGHVKVYLQTVDLGTGVEAKYGHTQLRVVDTRRGSDNIYTYAMYDPSIENFVMKFLRGELLYETGSMPTSRSLGFYQRLNQPVYEDLLLLNSAEKVRLVQLLNSSMTGHNRYYRYGHFRKNCSTKLRDILDKATKGRLSGLTAQKYTPFTYRDMVREHNATTVGLGLLLDILINRRADKQLTYWEHMFLPLQLRENLRLMPAVDDSGQVIASSILGQGRIYNPGATPTANYFRDYVVVWIFICLPLLVMGYLMTTLPYMGWSFSVFGIYLAAYSVFSTIFGVGMIFFWADTIQLIGYHNANLWLFWPTDFVYLLYAGPCILGNLPTRPTRRFLQWMSALHLVALFSCLVFLSLGVIVQNISSVMFTFGVVKLIIHALILTVRR